MAEVVVVLVAIPLQEWLTVVQLVAILAAAVVGPAACVVWPKQRTFLIVRMMWVAPAIPAVDIRKVWVATLTVALRLPHLAQTVQVVPMV